MYFLKAQWQDLIMINYEVPRTLVEKYLPAGCEVDLENNRCFASLVLFQFKDCKVKGISWPGYRNFSEINLRLYVTFKDNDEIKRGVIFVKEFVPKKLIAFIAQKLYKEPYFYSQIDYSSKADEKQRQLSYSWQEAQVSISSADNWQDLKQGSHEEFILEHYWGYSKHSPQKTNEYEVIHPAWQFSPIEIHKSELDFAKLYGQDWGFLNQQKPYSSFIAKGSEIAVSNKQTQLIPK